MAFTESQRYMADSFPKNITHNNSQNGAKCYSHNHGSAYSIPKNQTLCKWGIHRKKVELRQKIMHVNTLLLVLCILQLDRF
jgi:hypothetical protein